MVGKIGPTEDSITLRFGGGEHSSAAENDIDPREAADGFNYLLDIENFELKSRPPFDKVGTAPNGQPIRGAAELEKTTGERSLLIQAGPTVYETDFTTWTERGTVDALSRLRGHHWHHWLLDDLVLITDLELRQPVMQWNGSSLMVMPHNLAGLFYAKYALVANERVWYANVNTQGTATPHVLMGSKVSDYKELSADTKLGSSGLGADDPFFVPSPNLRAINALIQAFDRVYFSTLRGELFRINGSNSTDFAIDTSYPNSAATGDEPMVAAGNSVVYGRQGVIEMVERAFTFNDIESDDLSLRIKPDIAGVKSWTVVYNPRLKRLYCFPDGRNEIQVLFKNLVDAERPLSPWVRWVTAHSAGFQPDMVMLLTSPQTGLDHVFFGDNVGNVYCLEGEGANGDGGSADIDMRFVSRMFEVDLDAEMSGARGWLTYRKDRAATIDLSVLWSGTTAHESKSTHTLPAEEPSNVWSGVYWGGSHWGASDTQRLLRQRFDVGGQGESVQFDIQSKGKSQVSINQVGLRFDIAGTS